MPFTFKLSQRLARMRGRVKVNGIRSSDRKSTRLNSSHITISYAVFCLKKKKRNEGQAQALTRAQTDLQHLRLTVQPHHGVFLQETVPAVALNELPGRTDGGLRDVSLSN